VWNGGEQLLIWTDEVTHQLTSSINYTDLMLVYALPSQR